MIDRVVRRDATLPRTLDVDVLVFSSVSPWGGGEIVLGPWCRSGTSSFSRSWSIFNAHAPRPLSSISAVKIKG